MYQTLRSSSVAEKQKRQCSWRVQFVGFITMLSTTRADGSWASRLVQLHPHLQISNYRAPAINRQL